MQLDRRLNVKRSLLVGLSLLWIVVVALTFALLRRRQRFVELKDTFVRAVTHELKTPLASIRLQAETLERKLKGDPRARDYPARIVRDIDGLGFLVENLLSFSRLERGRITPKTARTSLLDLVNESRTHVEAIVQKPMAFSLEDLDGIAIDLDSDLVRLCLDNLAKNAAQYNTADVVEIVVRAKPHGDSVRVTYKDNGVGIPEEERARIFEDFFRGQNRAAPARGSGLGLAICDAVMSAHGGRVSLVESGPSGTTFALDFPRG